MSDTDPIEGFIARWSQSSGAERANYALFLTDLCDTLGVPRPDPTVADEFGSDWFPQTHDAEAASTHER